MDYFNDDLCEGIRTIVILMVYFQLLLFSLVGLAAGLRVPSTTCKSKTHLSAAKVAFFETAKEIINANDYESKPPQIPLTDRLLALKNVDVSSADNYWDGTLPLVTRQRVAATQEKNMNKRIQLEDNFNELMKIGFDRRLHNEYSDETPLRASALKASYQFELGKSKAQQLVDLKKKRLQQRSGLMKAIPQELHKYIDYLNSMRKDPKSQELGKNLFLGSFIAFVVGANQSARSSFMYYVVGNLIIMSSLLTRNMPQVKVPPGMDKRKVVSWSPNSFKTAVGITLGFSGSIALGTAAVVAGLPLSGGVKAKAMMIVSLIASSFLTAYYEVFEEKGKNGWRWAKSQESALPVDVEAKLANQVYGENKLYDLYDYSYDPQIDDYPPLPKYVDETDEDGGDNGGGSGELDEDDSKEHFDTWKLKRKEARRPPIMDAPPEARWVGGKVGLYVQNVPTWLSNAYKANVLKANRWRGKPSKFIKDTSEFDPIPGPVGFRDKRPEWLDLFGNGVWEEKITASRRAARAFGSYRKTMWRLDDQVVLLPCDGADKDKHAKKTKP